MEKKGSSFPLSECVVILQCQGVGVTLWSVVVWEGGAEGVVRINCF